MNIVNVKGRLQAAQAIASSIKTLLGPSRSTKYCVNSEDGSDTIICSNTAKILQYLEVEHPVGYIINDACQAMHKTHGCGCTTLVCMIGLWSRSALKLQHEGVPVPIICKLFDEALLDCFQLLEEIALPIQETFYGRSKHGDIQNTCSTASRPSRTIIEEVWTTNEEDISEVDIARSSGKGLLTTDGFLAHSLSLDGDENRETQHFVAKLPNQTYDKRILLADSRESLFDKTVEDEFDSCFDDLPVHVGTSSRQVVSKVGGVSRSVSSSRGMACKNHSRQISANKSELQKMDQMLKDLSFSGQKWISPRASTNKNVSEILKSCHNLSIDSPKTPSKQESCQVQGNLFHQGSSNLGLIGKDTLERLGKMLSHGKDEMMALAVEVVFQQMSFRRKMQLNRFDVDENAINIERIVGPASGHSQIVSGILLRQKAQLVGDCPLFALRVALVNGEIMEDFRHTGFKDSFQTRRIINGISYENVSSNTTSWLQKSLNVLRTLNIGIVIARGNIDKDLEDCCQTLKIQTFSGVSSKTLQLLSHSLSSTAVVYLTDLNESHIGRPVFLHQWNGPQPGRSDGNEYFVELKLAENQRVESTLQQTGRNTKTFNEFEENVKESTEEGALLQTILLCGPSESLVMDLELAFWNCVSCLRNTLNCGSVLPGAGRTELICIQKLSKIAENPDHLKDKPSKSSSWLQESLLSYRPAVYTAFADGLVEFLVNLLSNSGCMMNYGQALTAVQKELDDHDRQSSGSQYPLVADDFVGKKNAWFKAIGVVHLMLQSDMAIIAGSQASTDSVQGLK